MYTTTIICVDCGVEVAAKSANKKRCEPCGSSFEAKRLRADYAENAERIKARNKAHYAEQKGEILAKQAEYRESLSDTYIKQRLTRDSPLGARDIPNELIKLKRAQLMLFRASRNAKTGDEHAGKSENSENIETDEAHVA